MRGESQRRAPSQPSISLVATAHTRESGIISRLFAIYMRGPRGKSERTACTFLEVAMRTHGAPAGGRCTSRSAHARRAQCDCKSSHVLRKETSLIWLLYVNVGLRGTHKEKVGMRTHGVSAGGPMHIATACTDVTASNHRCSVRNIS